LLPGKQDWELANYYGENRGEFKLITQHERLQEITAVLPIRQEPNLMELSDKIRNNRKK
jgi:hypothetical protein